MTTPWTMPSSASRSCWGLNWPGGASTAAVFMRNDIPPPCRVGDVLMRAGRDPRGSRLPGANQLVVELQRILNGRLTGRREAGSPASLEEGRLRGELAEDGLLGLLVFRL